MYTNFSTVTPELFFFSVNLSLPLLPVFLIGVLYYYSVVLPIYHTKTCNSSPVLLVALTRAWKRRIRWVRSITVNTSFRAVGALVTEMVSERYGAAFRKLRVGMMARSNYAWRLGQMRGRRIYVEARISVVDRRRSMQLLKHSCQTWEEYSS